jgi:hypothetical protein
MRAAARSASASASAEERRGGGGERGRRISPSLLFVVMNYFCFITFFMFLFFHLNCNIDSNNNNNPRPWVIVFSPLVPVYLGLLYLHIRDLSKLHPNAPAVVKTKFYCSVADSISYFTTTTLLLFHLLHLSAAPVSFSAALTPLYLISIITLAIRFHLIPSPLSREWGQGSL